MKVKMNLAVTLADKPEDVAQWVSDLNAALPTKVLEQVEVAAADDDGASGVLDVGGQLERLRSYWPAFAPRLTRLHEGLVGLGFEPRVPDQRGSSRQASYVSYVDPGNGRNLGNTNSGTFTFMQRELSDEIAQRQFVKAGRYSSVHFDTEEAVNFILEVAEQHKV